MTPSALEEIVGVNLLDQPDQEAGFRALCKLNGEKPFECVGGTDESRAAMLHLSSLDGWKSMAIVSTLQAELTAMKVPGLDEVLSARGEHNIPAGVSKLATI